MLPMSSSAMQLMLGDPSLLPVAIITAKLHHPTPNKQAPHHACRITTQKDPSAIQGPWPAEPCSMQELRNSALTRGPHASTHNDDVETKSAFSTETRTQPRPRLHAYTTCM